MSKRFDCIVFGEICVDIPVRPVPRREPLQDKVLFPVEPIVPMGGGIVSNSGLALARLGMQTAAFGLVGDDVWADFLCSHYASHGLDTTRIIRRPSVSTSATAVLVDDTGEHTFAYHPGASRFLDKAAVLANLDLFAEADYALLGYYALLPNLEQDLDQVLPAIRETGCRIAMDTAGGGGGMSPLDRILPHLDYYIPSYGEGVSQTGKHEPQEILATYRDLAPDPLLGLKLGAKGVLLCPTANATVEISPIQAPGPVADTTGAGDCFYAGFLAGLQYGFPIEFAARIGAAAGACCVTQVGAIGGLRNFDETVALARAAN